MIEDPVATAGLVVREVRTGAREGRPTRIVVARRTYATDPTDLWDALTNPERLPRWFLPISGDLRVGGRYQFEGNAGGVVERCDEPVSVGVTWEMGPMVSWLDLTLTAAAGGTVLELAHEAPVDPEFWARFGPGAVGVGWDLGLVGLGLHVATGDAVDAAAFAGFTLSPEGVALVTAAASGWAAAAVADGDESGPAHEAAARTVAFYTTMPDGESGESGDHDGSGEASEAGAGPG